jgi:hypothetical protein
MILISEPSPWCANRSTGLAQVDDAWNEAGLAAGAVYCIAPDCGPRGPVGYGEQVADAIGAQKAAARAWNKGIEAAPIISRTALLEARNRVMHLWDEDRDSKQRRLELILV